MSIDQLTVEAMELPLPECIKLAQTLWQSIHMNVPKIVEEDFLRVLDRRTDELASGLVIGRSHEEVMQAARRAIGCA